MYGLYIALPAAMDFYDNCNNRSRGSSCFQYSVVWVAEFLNKKY